MKKETWVLVANSTFAKILKVVDNKKLEEVEAFAHPESRKHDEDLVSAKPGRTFDSVGPGRHAYESKTSPKLNEFNSFAHQLSHHLEEALKAGKLGKLYVGANPTFLGILRETFSPQLNALIAGEVGKDLTHRSLDEVRDHLPPVL